MSNFWKEFSFPSPIDDILKKPSWTLEELLDEDDIVVDVRSQKEELKKYLMLKENLVKLINYIAAEPDPEASDEVKFRYPVVACEILTSEVDDIERELVSDPQIMSLLFAFFEKEQVNVLLGNLVIRVITSLMNTRLTSILDYIKAQPSTLTSIVSHINIAAVPEFVIRLVNAESEYEGKGILQWLVDNEFPKMLISKFSPKYEKIQSDLARTIIEILLISNETSPVLVTLCSPEILDLLIEQIFDPENFYGFRAGLAVFSQILRTMAGYCAGSPLNLNEDTNNYSMVVRKVLSLLPRFNQFLIEPPKCRVITNQIGNNIQAFGFHRLVILQIFESFLTLGNPVIISELVKNHVDVYNNIFNLLELFNTNNFCHLFVERIFCYSISQSTTFDVAEFVIKSEFATKLMRLYERSKENKLLVLPFLVKLIYYVAERQRRTEELDKVLSGLEGWEDLTSSLAEEFAMLDHQRHGLGGGYDTDDDSQPDRMSSEGSVDSSNDADDYDTSQAEVLLGREELDKWMIEVF